MTEWVLVIHNTEVSGDKASAAVFPLKLLEGSESSTVVALNNRNSLREPPTLVRCDIRRILANFPPLSIDGQAIDQSPKHMFLTV
jgi:hypothetical protein